MRSSTSPGSSPSLRSMCSALVARTRCTRVRGAPASAPTAASMSSRVVRASEATVRCETASAAATTPAKSPGDEAAKPASITSTPSRSSARAISPFSTGRSAMPGDCSPSLNVVSKTLILRTPRSSVGARTRAHFCRFTVGVCGVYWPRECVLPLEGENRNDRKNDDAVGGRGAQLDVASSHLSASVPSAKRAVKRGASLSEVPGGLGGMAFVVRVGLVVPRQGRRERR